MSPFEFTLELVVRKKGKGSQSIIVKSCGGAGLVCFEGLFSCPEATSVLFHNFCIYHIDPPGHEVGRISFFFFVNVVQLTLCELSEAILGW